MISFFLSPQPRQRKTSDKSSPLHSTSSLLPHLLIYVVGLVVDIFDIVRTLFSDAVISPFPRRSYIHLPFLESPVAIFFWWKFSWGFSSYPSQSPVNHSLNKFALVKMNEWWESGWKSCKKVYMLSSREVDASALITYIKYLILTFIL